VALRDEARNRTIFFACTRVSVDGWIDGWKDTLNSQIQPSVSPGHCLAEQKLVPRREGRRVAPSVAAGGKSESRRRSGEAVDTRGAAHVRARALSLSSNNACSHAFLSWHGRSPSLFAERETASHLRTLPFDPPARSAPPPLPPVSAIGRQVPSFARRINLSCLSACDGSLRVRFSRRVVQIVGVPEDHVGVAGGVQWTTVREVFCCFEAHGVPLPAKVHLLERGGPIRKGSAGISC